MGDLVRSVTSVLSFQRKYLNLYVVTILGIFEMSNYS